MEMADSQVGKNEQITVLDLIDCRSGRSDGE
jgi:hypothetical protein